MNWKVRARQNTKQKKAWNRKSVFEVNRSIMLKAEQMEQHSAPKCKRAGCSIRKHDVVCTSMLCALNQYKQLQCRNKKRKHSAGWRSAWKSKGWGGANRSEVTENRLIFLAHSSTAAFVTLQSGTKKAPVPVVARFKACVCGRSLAGIAGSNPTGGVDVCLLCFLCIVS